MFAPYLADGVDKFLNGSIVAVTNWASPFLHRIPQICEEGDDYFVRNMMHLYHVSSSFVGMHAQEFIKSCKLVPSLPAGSFMLSTCMPTDKKGYWVPFVVVADQIADGLYVCTVWLCGSPGGQRTIQDGEWAVTPGIGFLSLPKTFTESEHKKEALKKHLDSELVDKIFVKDALYGILPLEESDVKSFQLADDLSWVDTGIDLILRLLLIRDVPEFSDREVGVDEDDPLREGVAALRPYKVVQLIDHTLGDRPDDGAARRALADKAAADADLEMDTLPNLIDFGDRAADGKI